MRSISDRLARTTMRSKKTLLSLLLALEGIVQDPLYHPEGDALYHSLQVFERAYEESEDPLMWGAALFHDIGKAIAREDHAEIGAELLEDLLHPRIVWLVRHHMDLHHHAARTRKRWRGCAELRWLEQLRSWDKAGRDPDALVLEPQEAIAILTRYPEIWRASSTASGTFGTSGASGTFGTSGASGTSGTFGTFGTSGTSEETSLTSYHALEGRDDA